MIYQISNFRHATAIGSEREMECLKAAAAAMTF